MENGEKTPSEAPSVLVVEDEPALLDALEYNLQRQSYSVLTASDGLLGLKIARRERPDLVILDIMLPGLDGLEICRILRAESSVAILMLTARAEEIDRVVGLELGADDYLTKPFGMRELLARVKALLRRARPSSPSASEPPAPFPSDLVFGDIAIDETRHVVRRAGMEVRLTPREYDLLVFLARNRGIVLSRETVLERVWGWEFDGESRTIDVHIRWLRSKLEQDPAHPVHIQTVQGVGYRLD